MRKAFVILLLSACGLQPTAFSQSVIRTLAWELNTARPARQEWQLVRGETVDLECRYLSGASAMDVRGAAVVLHCRTNGMAEGYSFQVTGRVGRAASTNLASVGWTTVRVRPDLDLPHNVKAVTFTLETTLDSARNLVASGSLSLSGDPTGASPASTPLYQYDAAGSAQAVSNALAASVQLALTSSVPSQISAATGPLATTQQVSAAVAPLATTQQLASAIAAIPPPSTDARRLVNSGSTRWVDASGDTWEAVTTVTTSLVAWAWDMQGASAFGATPPVPFFQQLPFMLPDWQLGPLWTLHADPANAGEQLAFTLTYDNGSGNVGMWSYMSSGYWPMTLVGDVSGNMEGVVTVSPVYSYTSHTATNRVATYATQADMTAATNAVRAALEAEKEIHADSYTNLLWRQVFSNGWCWLVAYTNTP